jgi:hypothetical protein
MIFRETEVWRKKASLTTLTATFEKMKFQKRPENWSRVLPVALPINKESVLC